VDKWPGQAREQIEARHRVTGDELRDGDRLGVVPDQGVEAEVGDIVAVVASGPPRFVEDDRRTEATLLQLQQVMLNLFSNAIEAMDAAGTGTRHLHVSSTSFAPETVLITVADSGPGLPLEDVNRIFDPFFTTKSQGMGMGLSICRSLVEAHNGKLSARSGVKQGAVFEIMLPAGDLSELLESA